MSLISIVPALLIAVSLGLMDDGGSILTVSALVCAGGFAPATRSSPR